VTNLLVPHLPFVKWIKLYPGKRNVVFAGRRSLVARRREADARAIQLHVIQALSKYVMVHFATTDYSRNTVCASPHNLSQKITSDKLAREAR
jgi:hypothetical protein